jgi:hypothetical protein
VLKPWQKQQWCLPQVGADFVAGMEDVLDLYAEPYNPVRPTVCFDETSKQLIRQTRQPLPARPGQVARYDYEYERNGTRNLFLFFEPLAGYRQVRITRQRTKQDFAHGMKWLVDEAYPDAEVIRVVLDNLNTHTVAALYDTFEAAEANRIRKRLEFHYTPKHGSWLNMAEIEFSIFARQAWAGYVPDEQTLRQNVQTLEEQRNTRQATVDWRFTSQDARVKLHRLYPSISD